MRIDVLKEEEAAEWDRFVAAEPESTCYQLSGWREVGRRAYGLHAPFLVAREEDAIAGVLPLFLVRSTPLSSYATTGLFGAYGPLLARSPEAGRALIARARELTSDYGARFLVMKSFADDPYSAGFEKVDRWVVAKMPLPADPAELWRSFKDKQRNAIRKGQKAGFELRRGPDQLEPFYDVLAENMHDKGSPIYGVEVLREMLRALGPLADVTTLWHGGAVVAGALTVAFRGTVTVPFASSRPAALHLNPNNHLYWELISRACRDGMKTFDFGRSLRDSTALAFKLRFGAATSDQPFWVSTVRGAAPAFNPAARGVRALTRLWRALPRPVADALGPSVCRRWLA